MSNKNKTVNKKVTNKKKSPGKDKANKAKRTRTKNDKLGIKQAEFCHEYIKTDNAKQSYKKVYQCSDKAAESASIRLLGQVKIHNYIKELRSEIKSNAIASAEEVLEYYTKVLRGELEDQWSDKISIKDRNNAAQALAKHHGIVADKVKVSGEVTHQHRGPTMAQQMMKDMFGEDLEFDTVEDELDTKEVS